MSYPLHQLAKALAAGDRSRADRWLAVLRGIASGRVKVGSRTPVKGLPAWVTPEVVRGGFATGRPAAAPGDLDLFLRSLEGEGLAGLLDSGAYAVVLPEHAALLTVAWLQRAHDFDAAERLVRELAPFARRLRFAPLAAEPDPTPRDMVWRQTAADSRAALEAKRPQPRVVAMNATLTVWNPYTDALLAHWLDEGSDGWHARGRALLARYDELTRAHTPPRKHTHPKENATILRHALAHAVAAPPSPAAGRGSSSPPAAGRGSSSPPAARPGSSSPAAVPAPSRGLLRRAIADMVAKRGAPGGAQHAALRAEQTAVAARPLHRDIARAVAKRLGDAAPARGIDDVEPYLAPIAPVPCDVGGGGVVPVPRSVRRVVERALAAPPGELIERGVIPSAEVLAELVPRLAAATVADAYEDEQLGELMAATYEAFRRRRTLLLTNLESQVRFEELPWVQAVATYRAPGADEARTAFLRLAELALEAFPATLLPNALLSELGVLAREAGLDLPLTEELAADIFQGTFSAKFPRAAQLAYELLDGTLYARYYALPEPGDDFAALCHRRAPARRTDGWVAANGRVIEQAQILTTHNLAQLVHAGAALDYEALAQRTLTHAQRLRHDRRKLAFAWRQLIFWLSFTDHEAFAREHILGTPLEPLWHERFLAWS